MVAAVTGLINQSRLEATCTYHLHCNSSTESSSSCPSGGTATEEQKVCVAEAALQTA